MKAPDSILKKIEKSLTDGEHESIFPKYSKRYKHDFKLQIIFRQYNELETGDYSEILDKIKNLRKIRELEASGGVDLRLSDRRKKGFEK